MNQKTTLRLAACLLPLIASHAFAQTAPASEPKDDTVKLEAFTVTGSHIRRLDEERTLPVTVMDRDDLAMRAAPTAAELLQMLPNGGVLGLTETNVLGADARGDNTALNLRGIGSGNTLVLVNGRRLAPHPISQAEGGVPSLAVNINQLPTAAIDRIEVLRDGASAIYGADAAAGVINTILRRDYTGYDLSLRGSLTEHGGGNDWRVTLSGGQQFNGGRTSFIAMIDYYHRDLLGTERRKFSRDADVRRVRQLQEPWTSTDTDFDNRSSTSQFGNFVRGAFDANGIFVGARPTGNAGISTSTTPSASLTASTGGVFFFVPLATGGVGVRQTSPSRLPTSVERDYYYNLNQDRVILPRTDRFNFFSAVDHQLSDTMTAFGELSIYRADSFLHSDPAGVDGTDDFNIFVGRDNPYNPFGSRFYHPTGLPNADGTPRVTGTPADVLIAGGTGVRPREFKRKDIQVLSESYRGVLGLKGRTKGNWDWETGLMYSRAWTEDREGFSVRHSALAAALTRSDATAFNPFGYTFRNVGGVIQVDQPYTNPASVVDPLYITFEREGTTELATWDFKLNGSIFDGFWGGPIGTAGGLEYRFESFKSYYPPFHGQNGPGFVLPAGDNDIIGRSPNLNLSSDRDVMSAFAEVLVPIVGRKNRIALVDLLELSVAGRYEKFSDFGDAFKPKYALAWRPSDHLLVRASYNESFRAPNLVQTNTSPLQRAAQGVSDPYRFEVTGLITDGSTSRTVFRQGSASLTPEESRISTFGFAFEVPWVKGLTLTADWWRMDQNKVIDNLAATGVLARDELLLDAFTQAAVAAGQSANTLDTGSGSSSYRGNTKVTRAPVTQADRDAYAAYNATRPANQHRAPVGRVISLIDDYLNLAGRDLEGFDLAVHYRVPKTDYGQFDIRASATYNRKFNEQLDEFSEVETVLEEDGRAKWRGNFSINWRQGNWRAGWFAEYYGGFMDPGAATTQTVYEALGRPDYIKVFNDVGNVVRYRWWVEDAVLQNAYVEYRFGRDSDIIKNVNLRLGVTNLTDEEPPIADESRGYQGGTISAKGRSFYLEVSKKF